jgi:hypothetical protein
MDLTAIYKPLQGELTVKGKDMDIVFYKVDEASDYWNCINYQGEIMDINLHDYMDSDNYDDYRLNMYKTTPSEDSKSLETITDSSVEIPLSIVID